MKHVGGIAYKEDYLHFIIVNMRPSINKKQSAYPERLLFLKHFQF